MIRIEEYVSKDGAAPYRKWFSGLDSQAAAVVYRALSRLAEGNTSNVKSVGEGVAELKIDRGPGYRVYFGWDGKTLVILLGGGTKRRQQRDIDAALAAWRDYKARKAADRRS